MQENLYNFQIKYTYSKRPTPQYFDAEDFVDASDDFIQLRKFLSEYDGHFWLDFQGKFELKLSMNPDLSLIFEDIPKMLNRLYKTGNSFLYFAEQGTDIKLLVHKDKENLLVTLLRGPTSSPLFKDIDSQPFPVPYEQFINAWKDFFSDISSLILQTI